ncbi:neuraminidase-like domain-containing protein [Enhygromyxa salina]|nr:neuraminidase-like domain-containing protein [Enhygromyxa salina]
MVVDLVLGEGTYFGSSEWDRVAAKLAPVLGSTPPQDIPVDRIEWLAGRADVFPTHLGFYIQAHRLADGRTIKAHSCYAFMRAGLPADLLGLLRAGAPAWESALRSAWMQRISSAPGDGSESALAAEVADEVAAMRELAVEAALDSSPGALNQGTLFDTAGLDPADQQTFMELWFARTGTLADFWAALTTALDETRALTFQFTIKAATLVGTHVPTLIGLQAERGAENISTVRDLAAWSASDWDGFLVTWEIAAPDDAPGADPVEQRQSYARALSRIVEDAYPTSYLSHAIARDELSASAPANTAHVATFLSNNVDFDITRSTISHYLDQASTPWQSIDPADQAAARANLEIVQRVYRMTPRIGRYDTAKQLLDHGITSAAQVVGYTRQEFVQVFGPQLPDDVHHQDALAGGIWDKATQIHSATITLASKLALSRSDADFGVLSVPGAKQFADADHGLADLSTILGNLDYCACEHCRSVFSPAAYLADLLAFLSKRPAKQAANALEALSERRPDIRHILLDCTNTNTPLPYIDLVNELLEAKFTDTLDGSSNQTTWTENELRIHPEHLKHDVYDDEPAPPITQLVFPWSLPFSLPTVEAQTYLRHLGVPRSELIARYEPKFPDGAYLDTRAAEVLGLNATEFTIIAGAYEGNPSDDDREFWGFAAGVPDNSWVGVLNGTHADPEKRDIGELLRRGRYTLDELREYLALDFVDPSGAIAFQWNETCNLDDASIAFLEAPELDRLHRLTRLQRRCGIPARMLNVLIVDACGGTLDHVALRKLADMVRVNEQLGLAWDELATLWANVIDPREYEKAPRALYRRRFLSKEFEKIGVSTLSQFNPASGGMLQGEGGVMTPEQRAIVLAAIGLKEAQLVTLISNPDLASDAFSFTNLTALFRCALFARQLRLSLDELAILAGVSEGLTGRDPFASPAATLEFMAILEGIRTSGLSILELDWLLRHRGDAPFDDERTGRELASLARGLATIIDESAGLADPDGKALATNLANLLVEADVITTLEIVQISTAPVLTQHEHIDDHLSAYLDASLAKDVLVNVDSDDYLLDVPARRAWLLGQVVSFQRRRALVVDSIASRFQIPATLADTLTFTLLHDPTADPEDEVPLGDIFMIAFADEDAIAAGITPLSHTNEFAAWTRLAKAAMLGGRFVLRADEAFCYSGTGEWLDFNALPLGANEPSASFDAWDKLRGALSLRKLFRAGELGHVAIAGAALAEGVAIFADHAGWEPNALATVAAALGFASEDLAGEAALLRLWKIAETSERLGVDANTLLAWTTPTMTMAKATAIKTAARAKHDESRWAKVAAPLRDTIRERQRDALVDAVIATSVAPSLRDRNAVFEHLLIDVEMSACMQTSRIKQAISSVQIYIHRALLHLEVDDVVFASDAIARWEWMKNYRVWEANRKVFLYPENWIEPELRSNKTPEFAALEATLMQGTLDQTRVEKALIGYLEQLARVSNLEIAGVCQPFYGGETWILGRTSAQPHEWFLRHRRKDGAWDPWETIPIKIDTRTVALIVRERRVHVFWANSFATVTSANVQAVRYSIGHVERSDDGWGKVQISEQSAPDQRVSTRPGHHLMCLDADTSGSLFLIIADWILGRVRLLQYFRFNPIDGKVRWGGSDFTGTDHVEGSHMLDDPGVISLQVRYHFDGQRYSDPSEVLGFRFAQGSFQGPVFMSRSNAKLPAAAIHHADVWSSHENTKLCPVVYDDVQRKYLLEPVPDGGLPVSEDDGGNVDAVAGFTIQPYYDECPPLEYREPLRTVPQMEWAQKLHDEVTEINTWPSGVPEQLAGYDLLDGVVPALAPTTDAAAILYKATQDSQAANTSQGIEAPFPLSKTKYTLAFESLYHPAARTMVEAVANEGFRGLYAPAPNSFLFRQQGAFNPFVVEELFLWPGVAEGDPPIEEFDFRYDSPYGIYNWELFFHVPMLIAGKLATEQRFEEAREWYHLIFNPIDVVDLPEETTTSKFWRLKPFVDQSGALAKDQLELMLGIGTTQAKQTTAVKEFMAQVKAWEHNPFDPHAVARVRDGVYQRTLLRKYINNLIEWADSLYRRDTIESINEATILYILVAQLLGPRPHAVPGPETDAKSFDQLADSGLDAFSNALVQLEGYIHWPSDGAKKLGCGPALPSDPWVRVPVVSRFWYFCYPPNAELLKYWDTIEDRLWKIRHCRNIEGVARQLPLFQPPIDPGLLVRATAAGVDIRSVLAELDSGLPPYRFRSVHARAMAFTGTLRSLGGELLAAFEKRDAESIARLRTEHELEMLDRVRDVRVQQIDEAQQAIASLKAAKATVDARKKHYEELLKVGLSERENRQFELARKANKWGQRASATSALGAIVSMIPQFKITIPPGSVSTEVGGLNLAHMMSANSTILSMASAEYSYHANQAAITAGYNRRSEDWDLQLSQAEREITRIDRDIIAAEIRRDIATRELDNHDHQAEQSRDLDRYMRGKFTNLELYDWMVGQLSTLYFQTYQLACDLAKRAERAYRLELAIPSDDPPIIKHGYWDSLRNGLLAGERLNHDLERLDLAYMDRDIREFELRKSVSLAELNPVQLRTLQETGGCDISLPELLFDLDHPGHYLRRIRAVRLTIPAVVGTYTSLGARLELVRHRTRIDADALSDYPETEEPDDRFRVGYGGGKAIATSTAVADGGLFNLDFRDERYLPFEYAGAISEWKLTLPSDTRQFDYRTISDVVLHVDYSARDGGTDLRDEASESALASLVSAAAGAELMRLFVVHDAFPNEWEQFLVTPSSGPQVLSLPVELEEFDHLARRQGVQIKRVEFALLLPDGVDAGDDLSFTSSIGVAELDLVQTDDDAFMIGDTGVITEQPGTWTLSLADDTAPANIKDGTRLDRTKVAGMLMIVRYTLDA